MATYLEKVIAAQQKIDDFYALLNLYKISRLNNGWVGSEATYTDTKLSDFNNYFTNNNFVTPAAGVTALFFDLPMMARGYNKDGNYSSGAPSDVGFTRNIPLVNVNQYQEHDPLYVVSSVRHVWKRASLNSTISTGGSINCSFSGNTLIVSPNNYPRNIEAAPTNKYWGATAKFIVTSISGSNYLHMLNCFVSVDADNGGLMLYITPNFINWNVHQIIPGDVSAEEWLALTGYDIKSYDVSASNAKILQNILKKYFRVLPNNNYLIMYPTPMYRGTDRRTMVRMYCPFSEKSIATITDPYNTESDYKDKATKGFSAYLTENGEFVLYYNNRHETPMVLYTGKVMGTYNSDSYPNYKNEIIDVPKVGKYLDLPSSPTSGCEFSANGMSMDCAINIFETTTGLISDVEIPAAAVSIALGDTAKNIVENPLDAAKTYDNVSLYVDKEFNMMNNIDVDYSTYINARFVNGEAFRDGNVDIDTETVSGVNANIYNGNTLKMRSNSSYYRDTTMYRATVFGNTMYSDVIKATNNPSLITNVSMVKSEISDTPRTWYCVCYGNGKYIALALNSTTYAYSTDGITWTENTIGNRGLHWWYAAYGKDKFVAISYNTNVFAYSSDGINWTEVIVSETNRWWRNVCYGNDRFVVVASNSNVAAYSTDGITWTETTIHKRNERMWVALCYGNGFFVTLAHSSNVAAYSTDGITWTEVDISNTARGWISVCYGNGKFVAVAEDSNAFAYTTHPSRWVEGNLGEEHRQWHSICFGDGEFVASALNLNEYAYSTDGINWTGCSIGDFGSGLASICYGNGKYVAVGYNSNESAYSIKTPIF